MYGIKQKNMPEKKLLGKNLMQIDLAWKCRLFFKQFR